MLQNHCKMICSIFFRVQSVFENHSRNLHAPLCGIFYPITAAAESGLNTLTILACNITCLIDCKGLLCIIKSVLIHDVDFIIICIHSLKRHRDIFIEIQKCFHMQTNLCCIINIGILRPFKNDLGNLMIIGPYIEHFPVMLYVRVSAGST